MIADCPECGLPADVLDTYVLMSTDGPVWHTKIRCLAGHFFNAPTFDLLSAKTVT